MKVSLFTTILVVATLITGCQSRTTAATSTTATIPVPSRTASAKRTIAPTADPTATGRATQPPVTVISTETAEPERMLVPSPTHSVGQPVRLQIPAIGVDAAIEAIGKDSAGNMAVPAGVDGVAWYRLGARPGEVGSAVMAGHLDDYLQQPAVFWRLSELREGDIISVTDAAGIVHEFAVIGSETYRHDQAPIARIFGSDGKVALNLITCKGEWDSDAENYDERLVVYTQLVGSP